MAVSVEAITATDTADAQPYYQLMKSTLDPRSNKHNENRCMHKAFKIQSIMTNALNWKATTKHYEAVGG